MPPQQQQREPPIGSGQTVPVGDPDPSSSIPLNASDAASYRTGEAENQEVPDTGSLDESASQVHIDETERTGEAMQMRDEVAFANAVGVEKFNIAAGEPSVAPGWV